MEEEVDGSFNSLCEESNGVYFRAFISVIASFCILPEKCRKFPHIIVFENQYKNRCLRKYTESQGKCNGYTTYTHFFIARTQSFIYSNNG